ncbi:MAG: AraC family transcriptional regulator [Pseudomonadota bacterium]
MSDAVSALIGMILASHGAVVAVRRCHPMLHDGDANIRFYRSPGLDDVEFFHSDVNGHRFAPHSHDHHALAIILEGAFALERGRGVQTLGPGSVVWVPAGEVHGGHRLGTQPCRYQMTYLSDAFVTAVIGTGTISERPFHCARTFQTLNALHRSCRTVGKGKVKDQLGDVLRRLCARFGGEEPERVRRHPVMDRAVSLLMEGDRDVADLARKVGLHPVTLSRLFSESVGLPPHAFRIDRKVQEARSRIQRGASLADVSADLGFADQSHLTRHFKRRFGLTPGAYSRQIRG